MLTNDKDSKNQNQDDYSGELEAHQAVLSSLREQVEELEKKLRMARGTGDVTAEAAAAAHRPATLEEQVEGLLRREIMTTAEVARTLSVPASRVLEVIRKSRARVANLGSPDQARWTWRVGDKATTAEIHALVERLISDSPMTFREICQASGVREGLVQGALIEIRRARTDILNLGTQSKGRWFIPTKARPAHLAAKGRKE